RERRPLRELTSLNTRKHLPQIKRTLGQSRLIRHIRARHKPSKLLTTISKNRDLIRRQLRRLKHIPLRSLRQLTFNKRHLSALRQAPSRRNHRTTSPKINPLPLHDALPIYRERRPLRELTSLNTRKHLPQIKRTLGQSRLIRHIGVGYRPGNVLITISKNRDRIRRQLRRLKHIPLRSLRQLTFNKRHLSALRQAHTRRNHRTISRKIKLRRPIGPRRRHRERRPLRELTSLNTRKHLPQIERTLGQSRLIRHISVRHRPGNVLITISKNRDRIRRQLRRLKHIPLRSLRQLTFNKRHLSALRQAHTRRRSEERRVGKEQRSRSVPPHDNGARQTLS